MKLSKAQLLMAEDGVPLFCFMTDEERKASWAARIQPKKESGAAMMSLTTNTRGATQMQPKSKESDVMSKKDYADMSGPELVEAYNKISGKPPIKKFKDRATALKRLAELQTAAAAKAPPSPSVRATASATAPGTKSTDKTSDNKLAAEFGARSGTNREKLLVALADNFKKQVPVLDLLKAVYGSKNLENTGALGMVLKGAEATIKKHKLPYLVKKEKNDANEPTIGLHPAK